MYEGLRKYCVSGLTNWSCEWFCLWLCYVTIPHELVLRERFYQHAGRIKCKGSGANCMSRFA